MDGAATFRRARASDATVVRAITRRAYAHYPARIGGRPGPMDADYRRVIATQDVWLTPAHGEPSGVIVLRPEADHVFVDNVAVVPGAQGSGIGRALLEHAERRARELGVRELRLLTHELMTENRTMYRGLGWIEIDAPAGERLGRVYFSKRVA